MTVEQWIRRTYIAGHTAVVGALERMLFPAGGQVGEALPPVPQDRGAERHPVILISGYGDNPYGSEDLARSLRRDGWSVTILHVPDIGLSGVGPGVDALRALVAQVRRQTGAARVDIVGHSQGGLIARAYVKLGDGAPDVARVVSMNTPQHGLADWYSPIVEHLRGTALAPLVPIGLDEQMPDSPLLAELNAGDPTPDGVAFTSIYSTDSDSIVKPATSPVLDGATNIGLVTPRRTLLGQRRLGPHHFWVNHTSVEAYLQLRRALLGEPPLAPAVAAAVAGAAAARSRRLHRRHGSRSCHLTDS